MKLESVFLRSYRSFHFDYKGKLNLDDSAFPECKRSWEEENDFASWRPSIEIPIQYPITCVVGLNESGKSHLIDAIWKVMKGEPFMQEDVCRYSPECQLGAMGLPLVVLHWASPTQSATQYVTVEVRANRNAETDQAGEAKVPTGEADAGVDAIRPPENATHLRVIYGGDGVYKLQLIGEDGTTPTGVQLQTTKSQRLRELLPRPVRVMPGVSVPSKVSLASLFKIALDNNEEQITKFLEEFKDIGFFADENEYRKHDITEGDRLVHRILQQCANLDYAALCHIARAPEQLLKEFSSQATERAEELLNLSHWWAQDVDTHLDIDLRSREVVLNVTDRTGSWYGFSERSQGMRYFLGYLIQVVLELNLDDRSLLILSDEPDFALSAIGQRDLLRFFRKVVSYPRKDGGCQIIFTTHSAEMIDPNYPDQITILRKGLFEEGTLVVGRAYHRLFEPIRTALGGRGNSLPFIDGPNLVVEGDSDRVFVTRMCQYLAKRGKPHLDLAYLSIVIAEGCRRLPGIVTTAKSMPGDRAYLTVLVDNDESGRTAEQEIGDLDPYIRDKGQIVRVDAFHEPGLGKDTETEDLVPARLYFRGLRQSLEDLGQAIVDLSNLPDENEFVQQVATKPTVDVVEAVLKTIVNVPVEEVFDKSAAFERVFDLVEGGKVDESIIGDFDATLERVADVLLEKVNDNLRYKRHDEVRRTMQHAIRSFVHAHGTAPTKVRGMAVLETVRELGNRVSVSGEFDKIVDTMRNDFGLRHGLKSDPINDHVRFLDKLRNLPQQLTVDPNLKLM